MKRHVEVMGRTAYSEEHLWMYLKSLTELNGYTIGLILGQSTGQKDYVIHLAKTPPPLTGNIVEETSIDSIVTTEQNATETYIQYVKDIPVSWVADHAKHVIRMLPGGMSVLGIFIVGPEYLIDMSYATNNLQKLKSVLSAIHKTLSWNNKHLCGDNHDEKLILNFNSITYGFDCISVDVTKDTLKRANWKFQKKATEWHQLEALVDFDRLYLINADKDPETFKKQLQNILTSIANLIDSSLMVIEGEVRPLDVALEVVGKKKKGCKNKENYSSNSYQVSLYIPCSQNDTDSGIKMMSCSASIRLIGQLVSRTFVHQKASILEAKMAVKQDIIRSLVSRLKMHLDSVIEEENGSPEENITLHEPPRRVLIALPTNKVTLSDYLFPGEGPQEALISLQELLDLKVHESQVQKEVELQAELNSHGIDPTEFYNQSDINTKPSNHGSNIQCNVLLQMNQKLILSIGLYIAFLVVIYSYFINEAH